MSRKPTKINSIIINRFRGLSDIEVKFADRITLISGKNGTSKSTILGIIAQIFSFSTDYTQTPVERYGLSNKYKSLFDRSYESKFSEHFKLSENFDLPGSMDVQIKLYDGIEGVRKDSLVLKLYDSKDRSKSRPVLRGNNDRNVTNPVIFLSVNRLTPIVSRTYTLSSNKYLEENQEKALQLINRILLQQNTDLTITDGSLKSLAPHKETYDHQSISVGEDNVGQIVRALLSFKKLSEEYENYAGGVLLIDEVDAGLFPAAQIQFLKLLFGFCKKYSLQVIMTSHSPTMIEAVYDQRDKQNYQTVYLTNTYGSLEVKTDFTWADIESDLHVKAKVVNKNSLSKFPKVNIYCEDDEARQFFKALVRKRKLKQIIKIIPVNLGSEQYMNLVNEGVPEFSKKSVIVLDGDKKDINKPNICILPGELPPDQLLYDFMRFLPENSVYWKNNIGFAKPNFYKIASDHLDSLGLNHNNEKPLNEQLKTLAKKDSNKHGVIREQFKRFYKEEEMQDLFIHGINNNPYTWWCKSNTKETDQFLQVFVEKIKYVLKCGHYVPKSQVESYFDDL